MVYSFLSSGRENRATHFLFFMCIAAAGPETLFLLKNTFHLLSYLFTRGALKHNESSGFQHGTLKPVNNGFKTHIMPNCDSGFQFHFSHQSEKRCLPLITINVHNIKRVSHRDIKRNTVITYIFSCCSRNSLNQQTVDDTLPAPAVCFRQHGRQM